MNQVKVIVLFTSITLLSSCFESTSNISKFRPNLAGFVTKIDIVRFDDLIFQIDTNNISSACSEIERAHPTFFNQYLTQILGTTADSPVRDRIIQGYINYPASKFTYDTISDVFMSVDDLQEQLDQLSACVAYYGLKDHTPIDTAIFLMSEFSFDRAVSDQYYLLPLDMALGRTFFAYLELGIPLYQRIGLTRKHLVPKTAHALAEDFILNTYPAKPAHMIDEMIQQGKIFFLTSCLLPDTPDSLLFTFTDEQIQYCLKGERALFKHLAESELLYNNNPKEYNKYLNPGPFNPSLSLPGNAGSWLGYRIVSQMAQRLRNEMHRSSDQPEHIIERMIIKQILQEQNPQIFLKNYKA